MMIKGIEKGSFYVIQVSNNVEANDLPALRETVEIALMVGHRYIAFDLSGCTNLKSSFIGLIANIHKKCLERKGLATILSPSKPVTRLIDASRLGTVVEVFGSEKEAETVWR
jgi:anti-anti-sigma factor